MNERRVRVATAADVPPGQRIVVTVGRAEIGLFNVDGEYYALRNKCPHEGAPLCKGSLGGATFSDEPREYTWDRDGMVLRCPWHGWEFDLETGRPLAEPSLPVKRYETDVSDGEVFLWL